MEQSELTNNQIKWLCQRVTETLGMKAETPKHFEELAAAIFRRTGILLSPTTLKRVWGYLPGSSSPRKSTLDILAQCCGWSSFDDFAQGHIPEAESGFLGGGVLNVAKDVRLGDKIKLMWRPARVCIIRYLGNNKWIVDSSEGTRLSAGDTFSCPMIVCGEPLYLNDLVHEGSRPGLYVCGRTNGVTFCRQ